MKPYVKKIIVALLAVTLFSALATNAYASITQTQYSVSTTTTSYKIIDSARREKQTSTPLYLQIDRNYMTASYFVRAMGCTYTGSGRNLTYSNGNLRDYVRCSQNSMWGIQSLIYERGYGWCYIEIMANGIASTTTGYWAADTDPSKNYNIAEY